MQDVPQQSSGTWYVRITGSNTPAQQHCHSRTALRSVQPQEDSKVNSSTTAISCSSVVCSDDIPVMVPQGLRESPPPPRRKLLQLRKCMASSRRSCGLGQRLSKFWLCRFRSQRGLQLSSFLGFCSVIPPVVIVRWDGLGAAFAHYLY